MISLNDYGQLTEVEEATETIAQSEYGLHCLLIYHDLDTLREFYSNYIQKQINDNELIQIMPFYETENSVRDTLFKNRGFNLDIVKKDEKSLIVIDSLRGYPDHDTAESIWKNIEERVKYAEKHGKKGLSNLGDMGAFLFENKVQLLLEYECYLPLKFNINLKGICMYHQKDFGRISEDFQQKIMDRHAMVIKI
ncbi:MAG: MEDS domain-containing protein [Candidatus Nitrosocosmicus sp.]|nr:MEDS domain-containing protein [Candidatus Nitrosocosmicus sp.]